MTPTQRHISPSIRVYEEMWPRGRVADLEERGEHDSKVVDEFSRDVRPVRILVAEDHKVVVPAKVDQNLSGRTCTS